LTEQFNDDIDIKNLGKFIKTTMEDVVKESKDELEASDLEWKPISSYGVNLIKQWYITKSNEL